VSKLLTNLLTLIILFVLTSCEGGGGGGESEGGGSTTTNTNNNNNNSPNTGSDPLYQYAWHLENTGQSTFSLLTGTTGVDIKVKNVIDSGVKGNGVKIAVSDTGIEIGHEDLSANYITGVSKNFYNSSPYIGNPEPNNSNPEMHGTAVTGIISAVGWNGKGSRGVAPESTFGGYNYIAKGVVQSLETRLYQMQGDFDIFNYSYGSSPCYYRSISANATLRSSILDAYNTGVTTLRSGRGAIYVKSAGNEYTMDTDGCGYSGTWQDEILGNSTLLESNNYPYTIIVGATNAAGFSTTYSSPGSNLWISSPGGESGFNFDPTPYDIDYVKASPAIIAPDISGCTKGISKSDSIYNNFENNSNGLNSNCNYTSAMNGTSSAAPIVSGVVALMLEENPNLSWRDVKHILASTAYVVDTNVNDITHPGGRNLSGHAYMHGWKQNNAGYWFHNWYGFGNVHAENAVNMAKNYNVDLGEYTQTTNLNDDSWIYDSGSINLNVPNNNATGASHSLSVNHNYIIESIQIRVSVSHGYAENLGIELTSPSGTVSKLVLINSGILDYHFNDVLLASNAFYGEESKGIWTLKVVDGSHLNPDGTSGTSGTLTNWKLNVLGHKPVNPTDSTPPNPVTNIQMASFHNSLSSSPQVNFTNSSSTDVARYEVCVSTNTTDCTISSWEVVPSVRPFTISGLSLTDQQSYYVNIVAIDNYENISSITSKSWQVDLNVPAAPSAITLITPTSSPSNNTNPTIEVQGVAAGNTVEVYSDSACSNMLTSGIVASGQSKIQFSFSSLSEATHTYYAVEKNTNGNSSSCSTLLLSYIVDLTAPTSNSISINNSSTYTTSTSVTLSLSSTGASQMYVTNTAGCSAGGSWETYSTSKSWTLGQTNATVTVYAKYRDAAGNESSCISDTIIHDNQAPTSPTIAINSAANYTNSTSVTLSLSSTGASQMYVTNIAGCSAGGSWETYSTSKSWTLGQTNATATVYAKYRDAAGNETSCISDTIIHDNIMPSSISLGIDNNSGYTNSNQITLKPNANGANQMYITNVSGCGSGGVWEAYSQSKLTTLSSLNTTHTFYVIFKDNAGNTTNCISKSVIHDNISPTDPSSLVLPGEHGSKSLTPEISWSESTDENTIVYVLKIGSNPGANEVLSIELNSSLATPIPVSLIPGNTYHVTILARDLAGNASNEITGQFVVHTGVKGNNIAYYLDTPSISSQDKNNIVHNNKIYTYNSLSMGIKDWNVWRIQGVVKCYDLLTGSSCSSFNNGSDFLVPFDGDLSDAHSTYITGLVVHNSKLVVTGAVQYRWPTNTGDLSTEGQFLLSLNFDGTIDNQLFNDVGIVESSIGFPINPSHFYTKDNKYVLVGNYYRDLSDQENYAIYVFDENGSLEKWTWRDWSDRREYVLDTIISEDSIVSILKGTSSYDTQYRLVNWRLNDIYNEYSYSYVDLPSLGSAVIDRNSDSIFNTIYDSTSSKYELQKINFDGTYDSSFGFEGSLILSDTHITNLNNVKSIIQDEDNVYICGDTIDQNSKRHMFVFKVTKSGKVVTLFGNAGLVDESSIAPQIPESSGARVTGCTLNNDKLYVGTRYYDSNTFSSKNGIVIID
jgi:subtilisin family serine protease